MSADAKALPAPEIDAVNGPYWAALKEGRLAFQSCANGHRWLPPRTACPRCLSTDLAWTTAAGTGRIVSWVVYRVAFHPAFADRLPYNVAIVELDEGPRLVTNVNAPPEALTADACVRVAIETEGAGDDAFALARFDLVDGPPAPLNHWNGR